MPANHSLENTEFQCTTERGMKCFRVVHSTGNWIQYPRKSEKLRCLKLHVNPVQISDSRYKPLLGLSRVVQLVREHFFFVV